MKIERHHSLVLADQVLLHIRKLAATFPAQPDDTLYIRTYSNCREQGWHLTYKENGASICEHRNSDKIRIWYGHEMSFEDSGTPQEFTNMSERISDRCFNSTPQGIKEAAAFTFYYLILNQPKEL